MTAMGLSLQTRSEHNESAIHPKLSVKADVADRQGWATAAAIDLLARASRCPVAASQARRWLRCPDLRRAIKSPKGSRSVIALAVLLPSIAAIIGAGAYGLWTGKFDPLLAVLAVVAAPLGGSFCIIFRVPNLMT